MPSPQKSCPTCGLKIESSETTCPRDGTSLTMGLGDDPVFAQKYRISESIGAGGMGVIYKATHLILGKTVAVKVLKSSFLSEDSIRRFQIEGKAASLLSHQSIITIYDFGITGSGQPYMVMDYVNGQTLAEMLSCEGQLTTARFLPIFIKVCEALAHAHDRKVLHRDIKPSNIMLFKSDLGEEVKIMDFGIAKLLTEESSNSTVTKTGETIGSPVYMSPEQARGMKTDGRADLYSLGCVMYEALTGAPPFQGNTALDTMMMHQSEKPLPLSEASMGKKIDWNLDRIVMRLLEKNPDDRYQTMAALLADLKTLQSNGSIAIPTKTLGAKKSGNAKTIAIVASLLVLTAAVTAVTLNFLHGDQTSAGTSQLRPVSSEPSSNKVPVGETSDPILSHALLNITDTHNAIARMVSQHDEIIDLAKVNAIEAVTDQDMALLKEAVSIKELKMPGLGISDKGLAQIANLRLNVLNLDYTDNIKCLTPIQDMQTLRSLSLRGTKTGADGLKVISKLANLQELDLSTSDLNGTTLQYLTKLKKLKRLRVERCNNLLPQDIIKFNKALQADCLVVFDPGTNEISNVLEVEKKQHAAGDWLHAEESLAGVIRYGEHSPTISPVFLVNCYAEQAQCQERGKRYEQAADSNRHAIEFSKEHHLPSDSLIGLYYSESECYDLVKKQSFAIPCRQITDKLLSKLAAEPQNLTPDHKRMQVANLFNLSADLAYEHKTDTAVSCLMRAQALSKQYNVRELDAELNAIIIFADAYSEQGKQEKALKYFHDALAFIQLHPNPDYQVLEWRAKKAIETIEKANKKH